MGKNRMSSSAMYNVVLTCCHRGIGFQPVPGDHCAWPCEIANAMGVTQSRRSIGAGDRLEAYAIIAPAPRRS
jgi:hypothetical protein